MKKMLFTIISLVLVTTIQAQIKPKIKLENTIPIKKGVKTKTLKVDKLKKITITDFQNLKIPIATISKEKLNAEPTKTWVITPLKLKDGFFQLLSFQGNMTTDRWSFGGRRASLLRRNVEKLNNNGSIQAMPLKVKFRASGGVEYRIKIKNLGGIITSDYIFLAKRTNDNVNISRLTPSEQNEYNYIFKEPSSGEITLEFSAIPSFDSRDEETLRTLIESARRRGRVFFRRDYWRRITIKEVRIDKIN